MDDPLLVQFNAFERRFGNDDAVVIAVHSPSGVFDADTAGLLNELTAGLWQVPEVIRVDSLANFNWVHAAGDDIMVDSAGHVYVTGLVNELTGGFNAWIAKYDSSLTLISSRSFNSSGTEQGRGIMSDGAGNVYVAGIVDEATVNNIWVAIHRA